MLGGERRVVARSIATAFGDIRLELMPGGCVLQERREGCSRSNSANVNLMVANAPDHIHIDHGHCVFQRKRRMVRVITRSEQSQFLAREGQEQNATLAFWLF